MNKKIKMNTLSNQLSLLRGGYKAIPTVFANVREAIHSDRHFERNKVKPRNLIGLSLRTYVKQSKKEWIATGFQALAMTEKKRLSAFTLAETLLTLIIVGVVATMTIPAVMHHIEKVSLHTAFLKAYSTAEQAHKVMMRENGGSLDGSAFMEGSDLGPFITNAFNANLKCSPNKPYYPETLTKCWHKKFYYSSGATFSTNVNQFFFTTNDGMLWQQYYLSTTCSNTIRCLRLGVDVNGFKKPNMLGRDIFYIEFFGNRILPNGAPGTADSGTPCSGGGDMTCAFYELINKPKIGYLKGY